jgi:menaquinone-dependent protoporphyrinogen IX oxidase
MNDKILVAYFTKGGASEEYAQIITETLTANGFKVDLCDLAQNTPDIASCDTIVLGTGVRMSMVYRRWRKILKQKAIKNKHLFLFLSSGMAADEPDKAVEKFIQPLAKKYGLAPDSMISFPGKVPEKWEKYDEVQKVTMKPDHAKKWAEEIAHQISK